MAFLQSLTSEKLESYHSAVAVSVCARTHQDVLAWLQGDMQRFLPQDILIAAWGDFSTGDIQHDIISTLKGVRSRSSNSITLKPTLLRLFRHWRTNGKSPFGLETGITGFMLDKSEETCALAAALQNMRCLVAHGISDARGSHDCLYVAYSAHSGVAGESCHAMALLLPYIDTALRQVQPLPHQANAQQGNVTRTWEHLSREHELTGRELEILRWVALGKTNPEIGSILDITEFSVKNHMQRVFKKLQVCNRAQAVSKFLQHV